MLYINTVTNEYPANPRTSHPTTSFPENWPGGEIEGTFYAEVIRTNPPEYSQILFTIKEGTPERIDDKYYQTWELIERSQEDIKKDLHGLRKEIRTQKEISGFTYLGHEIDSDRDSIQRITQAAAVALQSKISGQPFNVIWICKDDEGLSLDADGVIGLQQALTQHGANCHDWSQTIKNRINTEEDLETVLNEILSEV